MALNTNVIPRAILFGNPTKAAPAVSPNGQFISYLAPFNNVLNIWVRSFNGGDERPLTSDVDRGIHEYRWVGTRIVYLQDCDGDENWRLFVAELGSNEAKPQTPKGSQALIVGTSARCPDELVITLNSDNPEAADAYRVNLRNGTLDLVEKNKGGMTEFLVDPHLRVLGAVESTTSGAQRLLIRSSENDEWASIVEWDYEDGLTSSAVAITEHGGSAFLRDSRGSNTSRLVRIDRVTGAITVVAADEVYDVSDVELNPATFGPQMVSFVREKEEWTELDSSLTADLSVLRAFQNGVFRVLSRDAADVTWIVAFMSDVSAPRYCAFSRVTKAITFLFDEHPALANYELAPMQAVSFAAADGVTLHGYLTLPIGQEPKNLPMVVNIHGGPWSRNSWGFRPDVQWLANRGYICLQVNFRGSTGYGKAFVNAGDREWGGKMLDDVVSAVTWAINCGYADPRRVAAYGFSSGGYLALAGAAKCSDIFCCAVSVCGPSNLITLIESIPPQWVPLRAMLERRIGHPVNDFDLLQSHSPLFAVDQIRVPILLIHGGQDPRVKESESAQIVEAMRSRGLTCEYHVFADEGHGFAHPENNLKFAAETEKFLGAYLRGHVES